MSTAILTVSAGPAVLTAEFYGKVYSLADVLRGVQIYKQKYPHLRQGNDYQVSFMGETFAPKKLVHCISGRTLALLGSPECRAFLSQLGVVSHRLAGR